MYKAVMPDKASSLCFVLTPGGHVEQVRHRSSEVQLAPKLHQVTHIYLFKNNNLLDKDALNLLSYRKRLVDKMYGYMSI